MLFWINVLGELRAMAAKLIHIFIYMAANLVRFLKLTEFYQPTYNPNNIYFVRGASYERLTNERIDAIKSNNIGIILSGSPGGSNSSIRTIPAGPIRR